MFTPPTGDTFPAKLVFGVAIGSIAALVVLTVILIVSRRREKRQDTDKKEGNSK